MQSKSLTLLTTSLFQLFAALSALASASPLAETAPEGYFVADSRPYRQPADVKYPMNYMQFSEPARPVANIANSIYNPTYYSIRPSLATVRRSSNLFSAGRFYSSVPYFYPALGLY